MAEGNHLQPLREARRPSDDAGRRRRHRVPGLGAVGPAGLGGRRLQRLGRPPPPDAQARRMRRLGAVRAGPRQGRDLQVRDQGPARRAAAAQGRPAGARRRASAAHGLGGRGPREPRLVATTPGWPRARPRQRARGADLDLRVPHRLVDAGARAGQPLPDLRRARRPPDPLRQGDGLHPSRAAAGLGVPVRRLLGLPADRPVRADQPPRLARGLRALRRPLPRAKASACCSTGCPATSRPTRTASAISTARTSTSTPTRARASTSTGTR